MARDYVIVKHSGGAFLRIREPGKPNENLPLHAASEPGLLREAESIVNERFFRLDPFPGFHWVSNNSGWFTTDHDLQQ